MRSTRFIFLLLLALPLACKDGDTIEDIGSYTITTKDFENHYSTYLDKIARMANAEKSTLARLMCNPEQTPENPMWRDVVRNLEPKEYYESYRDLRIVEQAARKDNFLDDPQIKRIIEQVTLEAIAQLYIQKKMEERIKITEEEKSSKCVEMRQKFPQEFGPLSLDECLKYAEGFLKRDRMQQEFPRLRDEIKESITINKNQKFDKTDFLANKIEAYRVMKKTGGCEAASSTPATNNKPLPLPAPNTGIRPQ